MLKMSFLRASSHTTILSHRFQLPTKIRSFTNIPLHRFFWRVYLVQQKSMVKNYQIIVISILILGVKLSCVTRTLNCLRFQKIFFVSASKHFHKRMNIHSSFSQFHQRFPLIFFWQKYNHKIKIAANTYKKIVVVFI